MARDYNNPDTVPVISRHQSQYSTYDSCVNFIIEVYQKAQTAAEQSRQASLATAKECADIVAGAEEKVRSGVELAIANELLGAEEKARVRIKEFADATAAQVLEPISKLALEVKDTVNNCTLRNEELAAAADTSAQAVIAACEKCMEAVANIPVLLKPSIEASQKAEMDAAAAASEAAMHSARAAASEQAASLASAEATDAARVATLNSAAVAKAASIKTIEAGNFARTVIDVESTKQRARELSERMRQANGRSE